MAFLVVCRHYSLSICYCIYFKMNKYDGDVCGPIMWSSTACICLCLDARVIKTISTDSVHVRGVTSVDDKLFVLLLRYTDQVAVYSINDYRLLCHLHLPGLKPNNRNDLTSCVHRKCLYVSDNCSRCIHRHDLATSGTSQRTVPDATPIGLSVMPSYNLLVTCQWPNKLVELNAENGECVREMALHSDIEHPWHSVQLTTGQYVVSHGMYDSLHRVCIIDSDGRLRNYYGFGRGSDFSKLTMPFHVAVDKDSQFIFVADCFNERVTLLRPTLEFVRYTRREISRPCRLFLDHATRRLYVGQSSGNVVVIQL